MLGILKEYFPNITDEQFEELQEISYLKRDFNTWNKLPCEVKTKDGVLHKQVLIMFSDSTDLEQEYKSIISPEDIETIQVSELALPYQISNRTYKAEEVEPGLIPTVIQSKKTKEFIIINSTAKFLDFNNVKGCEIRQKKISYSKKFANAPVYNEDRKTISILLFPHDLRELF